MKRVFILFGLLCAFITLSSCVLDDEAPNFHFTTLNVVNVDMPDEFELNQTYDIEVTYLRPDGCTFFEGFDVSKPGTTDRDVVVIGSVLTDDNGCTQAIEEVTATLTFNVIYSGEYFFRFYAGEDTDGEPIYLEYTVPVIN